MKTKSLIATLVFLSLVLETFAQNQTIANDSISIFYDSLLSKLETEYLYKNNVDWKKVKQNVYQKLSGYADFYTSLKEIEPLLDSIKADHTSITYKEESFAGTQPSFTADDFSAQWVKKYSSEIGFEVKVIDNKYGYILMPAIDLLDTTGVLVNSKGQRMYDQIADLKTENNLEGWIIDLRFNSGGNVYPMLLALYDFLGNNEIWGVLDVDKKPIAKFKLSNGKYLENEDELYGIEPKGQLLDHSKVAIVIGAITASSGEIVSLAFKERKNTLFARRRKF